MRRDRQRSWRCAKLSIKRLCIWPCAAFSPPTLYVAITQKGDRSENTNVFPAVDDLGSQCQRTSCRVGKRMGQHPRSSSQSRSRQSTCRSSAAHLVAHHYASAHEFARHHHHPRQQRLSSARAHQLARHHHDPRQSRPHHAMPHQFSRHHAMPLKPRYLERHRAPPWLVAAAQALLFWAIMTGDALTRAAGG